MIDAINPPVGGKIKFQSEARPYTVRARSERFLICTKPFNIRHTTVYTIVDRERQVRGRENLIFGMGFETDDECMEALVRLEGGETQVSHRHCIPLDLPHAAEDERVQS